MGKRRGLRREYEEKKRGEDTEQKVRGEIGEKRMESRVGKRERTQKKRKRGLKEVEVENEKIERTGARDGLEREEREK